MPLLFTLYATHLKDKICVYAFVTLLLHSNPIKHDYSPRLTAKKFKNQKDKRHQITNHKNEIFSYVRFAHYCDSSMYLKKYNKIPYGTN